LPIIASVGDDSEVYQIRFANQNVDLFSFDFGLIGLSRAFLLSSLVAWILFFVFLFNVVGLSHLLKKNPKKTTTIKL